MRSFNNIMQISVTDLTPCVFCGNFLIDIEPFWEEQVLGGWVELPKQPELLQVGVVVVILCLMLWSCQEVEKPDKNNSGSSLT